MARWAFLLQATLHSSWGCTVMTRWAFLLKAARRLYRNEKVSILAEGSDPLVPEVAAGCTLHSSWGYTVTVRWAFLLKALIHQFPRLVQAMPFSYRGSITVKRWTNQWLLRLQLSQFYKLPCTSVQCTWKWQGKHNSGANLLFTVHTPVAQNKV